MAIEFFEFDRDGDLLLLLTSPLSADEKESVKVDGMDHLKDSDKKEDTDDKVGNKNVQGDVDVDPNKDGLRTVLDDSVDDGSATPKSSSTDSLPIKEVHMLVSSKALMLASPVFRAMLGNGTFQEGKELQSTGRLSVPLPDDNPDAFRIILNIIHLRNRQVPKIVAFDTLVHLSILVDKYQMLEAVETYVEYWFLDNCIQKSLPSTSGPSLYPWLSIAWVFNRPDDFRKLTRVLMQESTVPSKPSDEARQYHGLDLPLPQVVTDEIWRYRQDAISKATLFVQDWITYLGSNSLCTSNHNGCLNAKARTSACDAQILGSILRSAAMKGLWPRPSAPYHDMSWQTTACKIREIDVTSACDVFYHQDCHPRNFQATHGVKQSLASKMDLLNINMDGLELEDFK